MDLDTRNCIYSCERVICAARIPQSDIEVVVVDDPARNGFARSKRYRCRDGGYGVRGRSLLPGVVRLQEFPLQRDWLVSRADSFQVAGNRVAGRTLTRTAEVRLARLRITRDDVEDFVVVPFN